MATLILGGNGLIGHSIAQYLYKKNKNIIICDMKQKKSDIPFIYINTEKENSFNNLFKILKQKKIKIESVINCTYPMPKIFDKNPLNINKKQFTKYIDQHLWSFNLTIRVFVKYFQKNKIKGHIINLASIYGTSLPDFKIYNDFNLFTSFEYFFSKHNIVLFTKYYAKYLKKNMIRINAISPGGINNNFNKKFVRKYSSKTITKKMLSSNDLNGLVEFLISKGANKITGQNFVLDDGFTL